MLQTVNPTSPFKSRLKDLLNEYADMQWDLLPIGKTKKSGKMKNNYPRALRIQRKSVLLQYITYLYNISQGQFVKLKDNKPPGRVVRQHTWEAFFILIGDGDFFPPPLIFLFLLQQVL